jgi:HEAT repeat protein
MDATRPIPVTGATPHPEHDPTVKAAAAWIGQLARTLKTCRLYDVNNPTVIRFREELAAALVRMLEEHGPVTYHFRSDDVLFGETSLYPARSREDNLALLFYRDGVHAVTFSPGIEPREVESLVDAVLQVSGQNAGDDDLVTLVWEAQLEHVEVDYVPAEGDAGAVAAGADAGPLAPWPSGSEAPAAGDSGSNMPEDVHEARSDDWNTGDLTVEVEATFEELESLASVETERFLDEHRREHEVPLPTATLAIAGAVIESGAGSEDLAEFSRFLPRVLRIAVPQGAWLEARESVRLLRRCGTEWSAETFAQELLQPISIASAVERVDQQDVPQLQEFIAFASELGEPSVELLILVLAESQQRRTRRLLAEAIAERCREHPQRLAPWLADPRWYVARNIVHILGWIGGEGIVGMLQAALRHADPRVRQEAVAALGQVDPALARPHLLQMLDGADTRMFCSALHQLAGTRDAQTAQAILALLKREDFDERPGEEKRAVYSALGATGDDAVVPELDAELHRSQWFAPQLEVHRQHVARCLARIGTPAAREALARGAQSRRMPVRRACEDALGGVAEAP